MGLHFFDLSWSDEGNSADVIEKLFEKERGIEQEPLRTRAKMSLGNSSVRWRTATAMHLKFTESYVDDSTQLRLTVTAALIGKPNLNAMEWDLRRNVVNDVDWRNIRFARLNLLQWWAFVFVSKFHLLIRLTHGLIKSAMSANSVNQWANRN